MASRKDTHDMGFIIMPSLQMDWELTGNKASLEGIVTAANSLASRFDARVGAIRSWDRMKSHRHWVEDNENNFLVIIDSMCNMNLLFYAGYHSGNQKLINIATTHAHTVLRTIVRGDFSTFHVCNLDPKTGKMKHNQTHQGYSDNSTWSRGQAWAILGFAQTYWWTKDRIFLEAATQLSTYFIRRLLEGSHSHPYVPLWDFDAPFEDGNVPARDTSAAMIAANGFLLLHRALGGESIFLQMALRIAEDVAAHSLSPQSATLHVNGSGKIVAQGTGWDSILMNATANKNEHALMVYGDHGLVYADYYFLEFGNSLMRIGVL
ncbi:Glycoside hydrolase family 88 protein [Penicillium angulare]|uniref:Glycoside hydrolase family 88 protein n=1 Tax=Penicillium angulare TaxID=116970 RepID=UPI00254078F7|nr:Glycoside hydrolase family 88 protein [Penicillium angulare]KAJ5259638.1 Glycoside hydrolase family 88 protein [Penicillium angulare]